MARDLQAAAAVTAKASEVPKSWTGAVDPLKTSVAYLHPIPSLKLTLAPHLTLTPLNLTPLTLIPLTPTLNPDLNPNLILT